MREKSYSRSRGDDRNEIGAEKRGKTRGDLEGSRMAKMARPCIRTFRNFTKMCPNAAKTKIDCDCKKKKDYKNGKICKIMIEISHIVMTSISWQQHGMNVTLRL